MQRFPKTVGALCLLLCFPFLWGCSVSQTSKHPDKILVGSDDPVYDKRFAGVKRADVDLKNFWNENAREKNRAPVPLTNKTISRLVESVKDGVVNIYTLRLEERNAQFGLSPNDLLPIRIPVISSLIDVIPFKVPVPFKTQGISLGSGFILNEEGYILSNAHVVFNATEIRVATTEQGKEYPARIIGVDRLTDTALLKIEPDEPLTALPLADSDELEVGEMVLAIGNPLGLTHTVTSGLVSAKERVAPQLNRQMLDFIQTDSAINPGSSGGPLINLYGEVVGINTAIISTAQLVGFAIPINIVKEVAPLLVVGKPERGWFGVSARPLSAKDRDELNFSGDNGILVLGVEAGSPAEKAGVQTKDIIVEVNGQKIDRFLKFRRKLLGLTPGQKIRLTLFREGKTFGLTQTLAHQRDAGLSR